MLDTVLDLLVVLLPFLLSVLALFLTLEPLNERYKPHKWKWRIGLVIFGAIVSMMTYWQQNRQRTKAASDIRGLKEEALRLELDSDQRDDDLKKTFNAYVVESLRQKRSAATRLPKGPSAEEIAAEVDRRLSARLQPTPTEPPAEKLPALTMPIAPVSPQLEPMIRTCRDDRLDECSDEQLLENLKPLVENIEAVHKDYMTDVKKLDDIKGGKMDWLQVLAGAGGDKTSRWLRAADTAEKKAADHFRDCCAERALAYHKELLQRDHKRSDNAALYEWVQRLLKPPNSKEWKRARAEGEKVGDVYIDLDFFRLDLDFALSLRPIGR